MNDSPWALRACWFVGFCMGIGGEQIMNAFGTSPRTPQELGLLPVLPESMDGIILKDTHPDAIYRWTDNEGTWQPVFARGKWWKQKVRY